MTDLQTKVEANVGDDVAADCAPDLEPIHSAFMNMAEKQISNVTARIKKLGKEFGHDVDVIVQVKVKS